MGCARCRAARGGKVMRRIIPTYVRVLSLPLLAAACSDGDTYSEPITAATQSLSFSCPSNVPDNLKVDEKQKLELVANAEGVQVYVCQNGANGPAWTLE